MLTTNEKPAPTEIVVLKWRPNDGGHWKTLGEWPYAEAVRQINGPGDFWLNVKHPPQLAAGTQGESECR